MSYTHLIFSIKKSLFLIKKILQKKGQIYIIYLDPRFLYLFQFFNLKNFFILVKWKPGLFTNKLIKKPNLIILLDYALTVEKIKEIYKLNIPIIFFTQNIKQTLPQILYNFKYIINIKNIFLFLVILQKMTLLTYSYDNTKIKKKKIC